MKGVPLLSSMVYDVYEKVKVELGADIMFFFCVCVASPPGGGEGGWGVKPCSCSIFM